MEYEKFSALSGAFKRTFREQHNESCTNDDRPGKMSSSTCASVVDQQQELITRLFLQAIPPASPYISGSCTVEPDHKERIIDTGDSLSHAAKSDDLKELEEHTLVSSIDF